MNKLLYMCAQVSDLLGETSFTSFCGLLSFLQGGGGAEMEEVFLHSS